MIAKKIAGLAKRCERISAALHGGRGVGAVARGADSLMDVSEQLQVLAEEQSSTEQKLAAAERLIVEIHEAYACSTIIVGATRVGQVLRKEKYRKLIKRLVRADGPLYG